MKKPLMFILLGIFIISFAYIHTQVAASPYPSPTPTPTPSPSASPRPPAAIPICPINTNTANYEQTGRIECVSNRGYSNRQPETCARNTEMCPMDCAYSDNPSISYPDRKVCHYTESINSIGQIICTPSCVNIGSRHPSVNPSGTPSTMPPWSYPSQSPSPVPKKKTKTPIKASIDGAYLGCIVETTYEYADGTTSTFTVTESPATIPESECVNDTASPEPSPVEITSGSNCNSTYAEVTTTVDGQYIACEITTTCTLADGTTTTRTVTESPGTITESACVGQ